MRCQVDYGVTRCETLLSLEGGELGMCGTSSRIWSCLAKPNLVSMSRSCYPSGGEVVASRLWGLGFTTIFGGRPHVSRDLSAGVRPAGNGDTHAPPSFIPPFSETPSCEPAWACNSRIVVEKGAKLPASGGTANLPARPLQSRQVAFGMDGATNIAIER